MNAQTLFTRTQTARAELDALLAQLDDAEFTATSLAGGWSPKDLLAHVAWFDQEMVQLIQTRTLAGSDLWQLPSDARNAAIHRQNQDREPAEVRAAAAETHAALLAALATLDDQDMLDPGRFANMPAEWEPWFVLAENSCAHYEDHLPQLRALRG